MASRSHIHPLQFHGQPLVPSGDQSTTSSLAGSGGGGGGEGHVMRCLLIRHLPSWLNREEKESLLSHFGAQDVVIIPNRGKMKNCVFAAFADHDKAKKAMEKLHQLDVFGSRLVVEYAKTSHSSVVHEAKLDKWSCNTCKDELEIEGAQVKDEEKGKEEEKRPPVIKQEVASPPKVPSSSSQRYLYPLPTPSTITNITNAIACVPQLYVQVLHLMNKLNLPPPFGPPTSVPPMVPEGLQFPPELEGHQPQAASSDEDSSEIESDEETRRERKSRMRELHPATSPKRWKMSYKRVVSGVPPSKRRHMEESIAEDIKPIIAQSKKIEFHLPTELAPSQPVTADQERVTVTFMARTERRQTPSDNIPDNSRQRSAETAALSGVMLPPVSATVGGAGVEVEKQQEKEGEREEEEKVQVEEFITLAELTANRLSDAEMKEEHIFRNYSPGEPSVRLYLKNVAKQVDEKDLRYIYGRYVNWSVEKETNMFNVQLMRTGRMKGQGFIGLPSEVVAAQALRETNGYLLKGKPIVVHFARSSRPKESGV